MKRILPLLLLSIPLQVACTAKLTSDEDSNGSSSSNGSNGSNGSGGPGSPGGPGASSNKPGAAGGTPQVDTTPARLLTDVQYNNAVATLFGNTTRPLTEPIAATGELYDNDASGLIAGPRTTEALAETAEVVADEAFSSGAVSFSCASGEDEADCVSSFVEKQGLRVFRRPPTADETKLLTDLFTKLRSEPIEDSDTDAAKGLLAAMLQMPGFIYQVALGEGTGGESRLTGYEVASRLAFALTNSVPDDALLEAASSGRLDSDEGVRAEAERLLDSSASHEGLLHFVDQWLGISELDSLSRDETLFPAYTPDLGTALHQETRRFFEEILWKRNGSVPDLYSADFSFVNDELAKLYGIEGEFGNDFVQAKLPEDRRGILTQGSYLAAHSVFDRTSPIARGVYTLRKLMCTELGSVPNNVGALPQVPEGGTVRDVLEAHSKNPCATCHKYIDPVGLSFENYDAVGAYRDAYDNGSPVDATASVPLDGDKVDVDGGVDFAAAFADSPTANSCFTKQMMSYMLGRTLDSNDEAAVEQIANETNNLREIVLGVVSSKPFLYRNVPAPEVCE